MSHVDCIELQGDDPQETLKTSPPRLTEECDGGNYPSANANKKYIQPTTTRVEEPTLTRTMNAQPVLVQPDHNDHKLMEIARNRNYLMSADFQKTTILHRLAQRTSDVTVIQQIISTLRGNNTFDQDISQLNEYGHSPLFMAVFATNITFVLNLLKAGVRIDQLDYRGRNLFHYLAERGKQNFTYDIFAKHTFDYRIARSLLGVWDLGGMTPLQIAAQEDNTRAFHLFTQFGDDVILQRDKKRNYTLLHYAAEKDHPNLVDYLIRKRMEVDSLGGDEATPLHIAVSRGHVKTAETLLQAGANPKIFLRENSLLGLIPSHVESEMRGMIQKYTPPEVYQHLLQFEEVSDYEDDDVSMSDSD